MLDNCCFCLGPFENVREDWLEYVSGWDDPSLNPDCDADHEKLSFTPPSPTTDVVAVSAEDGQFWVDMTCVGPAWDSYVSPRGDVEDVFGPVLSNPYDFSQLYNTKPFLTAHPWCFSFLCRRLNATPEQIWRAVYFPSSDGFERYRGLRGDLFELEYYHMRPFDNGDCYYYSKIRIEPRRDGKEGDDIWEDPYAPELQWIFVRPTIFPVVPSLSLSVTSVTSPSISQPSCKKVFNITEILDLILDYIIGQDISQARLAKELQSDNTFTPPSIIQGTKDIFALLQVNKAFYTAILRDRQTYFLQLIWMHGWMLPATPEDWNNWPNGSFHNGTVFTVGDNQDWRAYLLIFLRKEDVHVKNRWRFQRMAMQFGRGRSEVKNGKEYRWRFPVGELAFRPDVKPLEPWDWEEEEK